MAKRKGRLPGAVAKGIMKPVEKLARQSDELPPVPPKVLKDSRGRQIPPGVKRLPSGRRPANSHLAGQQYPMDKLPPRLREKYPDGVRFTDDGFPDFGPYAQREVKFDPPGFAGNHGTDFTAANRQVRQTDPDFDPPDDYTWHHHQDGHTMQLVPTDLHDAVKHAGGVAIKKGSS